MPVLEKTKSVYRLWQKTAETLPKPFRFGLGSRIENLFTEILRLQFLAQFSRPSEKELLVRDCIVQFDTLKFFLQIAWENNHIKEKIFIALSKDLSEIGKELLGWKNFLEKKNSSV